MLVVNTVFSIIAIVVVLVIHGFLIRRHLKAPFGDVRSGLFVALAEWAVKKMDQLTVSRERSWKANLLVPTERTEDVDELAPLIEGIAYPRGFLKLVGLADRVPSEALEEGLPTLAEGFRETHIFAAWTVISAATFGDNLRAGIETFGGTFFRPTILLLRLPSGGERDQEVRDILKTAVDNEVGIVGVGGDIPDHDKPDMPVAVWFRDRGPEWDVEMDPGNQDLDVLVGYKLKRNWSTSLRLVGVVHESDQTERAETFLRRFADLARIPNADIMSVAASPEEQSARKRTDIAEDMSGGIHVLPVPADVEMSDLRTVCSTFSGLWLFTHDSRQESALA